MNNNTKHTPGPWNTRRDNMSLKVDFDHIANNDDCLDELKANAALIAAAPEMLTELENCLNFFRYSQDELALEYFNAIESILKKAKGE